MKMTKYFICCEKCYQDIVNKSLASAYMWMELCKRVLENENTVIEYFDVIIPSLRILEENKYILSTEREKMIAIRVNGYMLSEDGQHFFCAKEGHHE